MSGALVCPQSVSAAAGGRAPLRSLLRAEPGVRTQPVRLSHRTLLLVDRRGQQRSRVPADLTPVNQLLSPYGYHGAQIGKLHFVPHSKPQFDLTATVLDYCGVQVPRFVQGCSLRPLLEGSGGWHRSSALTEAFSEYGAAGSVTLQTSRYLYGCDTGGSELLYDKHEDPAELRDVVAEERYAAVRGELRHQLGVRLQQARFSARPRVARY